ncbi:hypothetical protein [Raineyella sp. W15-4]|uniref:hypothetical protein n=1 Tax=Raineyella sp. W15-4 TaxID=3081651 RepID=UPI002955045A|nr:hypothetical protein [Raineyella sp. W15-4]WOQ15629.1 hypothetical protein R0145_10295 [Raineyella sp. W15-4]
MSRWHVTGRITAGLMGIRVERSDTGVTAILQDWGDGDVQRILILAPDLRALIDALTHP